MKNSSDRNHGAAMDCERFQELVPTFVDGEASESLAGAVRKHLIDCTDCRLIVQEEKGLRQWFEPLAGDAGLADVVVPEGFAARVTAMAVASEFGASESLYPDVDQPQHTAAPSLASQERRAPRLLRPMDGVGSSGTVAVERNSLDFVMALTAAAAALMIIVTLMMAQDGRPMVGGSGLRADDAELTEELRKLDEQNALELQAEKAKAEAAAAAESSGIADPALDQPGASK